MLEAVGWQADGLGQGSKTTVTRGRVFSRLEDGSLLEWNELTLEEQLQLSCGGGDCMWQSGDQQALLGKLLVGVEHCNGSLQSCPAGPYGCSLLYYFQRAISCQLIK